MNKLQQEHGDWANKQFSSHFKDGIPNPMAPFYHLVDPSKGEVWELLEALKSGNYQRIALELADCQLLLYSIAHLCSVDLEKSAEYKFMVNRNRSWGQPDVDGIVEHV